MPPRTLSEKIWDAHVVHAAEGEPDLLFIDLHLIHEVTSPQAFDGLRLAGRKVRRPDLTVATADHNVPTTDIDKPVADPVSAQQLKVLDDNTAEFGITSYPMGDTNQGIVHIIGPEQGWTQPGMTIVCGDSHTSTHGAFGALAFGIGTSEVEHVLATQTLPQQRPGTMESRIRKLQAMLKQVEIVDETGTDDGTVSLGSTVTLRYEGDDEGDVQRFFVGSIEERQGDLNVISPSSPLGRVLVGQRAGDTVEYQAPGGMLKVHIVAVER